MRLSLNMSAEEKKQCIDIIDALLPQTQCELCEYPGCRPYATAIVEDNAPIDRCLPGGVATLRAIGNELGLNTQPLEKALDEKTKSPSIVSIDESLCIGCTKCLPVCPTDAIIGRNKRMHTVISDLCTGCERCIPACPMDCINIHPAEEANHTQRAQWRERFESHKKRLETRSKQKRDRHQSLKKVGPRDTSLEARQNAIQAALARIQEKRDQGEK